MVILRRRIGREERSEGEGEMSVEERLRERKKRRYEDKGDKEVKKENRQGTKREGGREKRQKENTITKITEIEE